MASRTTQIAEEKVAFIAESAGGIHLLSQGPNWIDIGCGTGDLLQAAKSKGFSVLGLEPDAEQRTVAQSRGLQVIDYELGSSSPIPNEIAETSIISVINVLEHTIDPRDALTPIASAMPPGSLIAIEVPRHPSLSSIIQASGISPIYRHAIPPEHLHIFSDQSIAHLLNHLGFVAISRWLFGSDSVETLTAAATVLRVRQDFSKADVARSLNALQSAIDHAGLSDVQLIVGRKVV